MDEKLYKETQLMPKFFMGGMVLTVLILLYTVTMQAVFAKLIGGDFGSFWMSIIFVILVSLFFSNVYKMTIIIDKEYFTVQFGLLKKKIALKEIISYQLLETKIKGFWQYGIKRQKDGTLSYLVQREKAVELKTKERKYIISSKKPTEICNFIKKNKQGVVK